jgi:DNA-binding PucR family transcriptional regulator
VVGEPVLAGLGLWASDPAKLPGARRTADRALELGDRPDDLVAFEAVQPVALLRDVEAYVREREGLPSVALRALADHDREHGTELAATLLVVLEVFGNTALAAERLHVHVNTVRYRVRQATELTGVKLSDPTARLALELELRARRD